MSTEIANIKKLLETEEFKDLKKIGTELYNEKKRFDLLSVFDELIDENAFSRLFAYLFDSKKEHGLKQRAIREWLKIASETSSEIKNFLNLLPPEEKSYITTTPEWPAGEGRRLDILIEIKDNMTGTVKAIIGIENKVNSDEQFEQVCDYQKSLIRSFSKVPKLIFFLTPDGRQSHTSLININCSCVSISYQSIIQVCDKLTHDANEQAYTFLKVLETHISKLINYNKMEKKIRDTIHKLYENPEYNQAIKLIGQYAPNIRFVFDELHERFKNSLNELELPVKDYNCEIDGSQVYITKETTEFQLYFDDFKKFDAKEYSPRYILHFDGTNPDVGDEVFIRLMLYDETLETKDRKSKQKWIDKILETAELPDSRNKKEHWGNWINIWVSEGYILKDLGNKDIEALSKLLCDSIRQTFDPLKRVLKKLSKE